MNTLEQQLKEDRAEREKKIRIHVAAFFMAIIIGLPKAVVIIGKETSRDNLGLTQEEVDNELRRIVDTGWPAERLGAYLKGLPMDEKINRLAYYVDHGTFKEEL